MRLTAAGAVTHYFFGLSLKFIFLRLEHKPAYLFHPDRTDSMLLETLRRLPFIKTWLASRIQAPDIHLGNFKGLYYQLNKEALECTESVCHSLNLENTKLTTIYGERFKTDKFKPFVLKWVSLYVLDLIECFYRVHLDKPQSKMLYLPDNPLNRHVYEWWSNKTGNKLTIKWFKKSEIQSGLEAGAIITGLFIYKLCSRRLCWPPERRQFKIMIEATFGLRNSVFRDDFFIDNETLLKRDLLLYTHGSSNGVRAVAWKEAQNSEYECVNVSKLKIPPNLIFPRLFKYHFLLPLTFIFRNLWKKQNYLLKEWLPVFHVTAINYEILLSHYKIGLGLSIDETGLNQISATIIMNNYGARNVIWHWSDMTSFDAVGEKFKAHNIYLVWGKIHYDFHKRMYFTDKVIETGMVLNHNYSRFIRDKEAIYRRMGIPADGRRVIAFYDESFAPDIQFTERTLLSFWEMMSEVIEARKDIVAVLKPKWGNERQYDKITDRGKETFNSFRSRCLESKRFYFVDNPGEIAVTEVIAISDINITMGMCSPSTVAMICGKIGLYYDNTGNDQHPFARQYKNVVVFDNKADLLSAVSRIIDQGYSPLEEIAPDLLKSYDHFRDEMGVKRFTEALVQNL